MRSRYHPDGSIDYDADRALEILRNADEELTRRHQQQNEEAMRVAATSSSCASLVAHKPAARKDNGPFDATAMGLPENPMTALMNPDPMALIPNPFPNPKTSTAAASLKRSGLTLRSMATPLLVKRYAISRRMRCAKRWVSFARRSWR